jgi:hypothetical protein
LYFRNSWKKKLFQFRYLKIKHTINLCLCLTICTKNRKQKRKGHEKVKTQSLVKKCMHNTPWRYCARQIYRQMLCYWLSYSHPDSRFGPFLISNCDLTLLNLRTNSKLMGLADEQHLRIMQNMRTWKVIVKQYWPGTSLMFVKVTE